MFVSREHPELVPLFAAFSGCHNHVGAAGEALAAWMFERAGYRATRTDARSKAGDLKLVTPDGEIKRVEVKTARRDRTGAYQFCLRKGTKTDVAHSEFVVLLCVEPGGNVVPFVVPTEVLGQRKQLKLTGSLRCREGMCRCYRQRGEALVLP